MKSMIAHYEVIRKHIAQWEQHFVEPDVFGTTDPYKINASSET